MNDKITNRIDPELSISEELYLSSLLDISGFLCSELTDLLYTENKYIGNIKFLINGINSTYLTINPNPGESDIIVYERVLFLYKPMLIKEFTRLKRKKLSPSEASILIIKKLIDIINSYGSSYNKEIKQLKWGIDELYKYINNKAKKDSLFELTSVIKEGINSGFVGKHKITGIVLESEKVINEEYQGDNSKMNESSENKLIELEWKE